MPGGVLGISRNTAFRQVRVFRTVVPWSERAQVFLCHQYQIGRMVSFSSSSSWKHGIRFPEQGDFMGYFRGRVTFVRYRVERSVPRLFGPEHLERLAAHAIGTQRTALKDGTEVGWITGEDILDTGFDLEKNIVND